MSTQVLSPLAKFYHFEKVKANQTFLRQPFKGQWHHITWQDAGQQIRRMSAALRALDLPPQSKIALISKNCAHWIMADLAIMMSGHVSVPLYPTINADTLRYTLEHSESKVLFVGKLDEWEKQKSGVPEGVYCISFPWWTEPGYDTWDDLIAKHEPQQGTFEPAGSDLLTIIYTSGTTGLPKGVVHNMHAISYAASMAIGELKDLGDHERFFSYLPLSHIAERALVEMGGLYTGGMISFAESLDLFAANLKDSRPTVFLAVPRIWTKFQMGILSKMDDKKLNLLTKIPIISGIIKKKIKEGLGLQDAKYLLTGAAPMPESQFHWFEKIGMDICEAYAMTENCAYSHLTRKENRKPGWVGQPLPFVETKIAEDGEILSRSEAVMLGYYKEPEKTAETITPDGYLRTGDQGEVDQNGFLKITGRVKDIFKTDKGKYVAPAPIEMELSKNTFIEQVCLVGSNLPQTMALVVLSADAKDESKADVTASLEATMNEVNAGIDKHERMKKVVVMKDEWTIENDLLTPTMKVKRNVLEKRVEDSYLRWYSAPETVVWEG
jgi:long-chain acyl-CoA synthetase